MLRRILVTVNSSLSRFWIDDDDRYLPDLQWRPPFVDRNDSLSRYSKREGDTVKTSQRILMNVSLNRASHTGRGCHCEWQCHPPRSVAATVPRLRYDETTSLQET